VHSAIICSTKLSLAESDNLVSETGGSRICRTLDEMSKTTTSSPDDWRTPLVHYLENPGHITDRKVWRHALKYVVSEVLWSHRISKHSATKVTPFELVYGQEAILPVELNLDAR
jgi:hypothetical protein